MILSLIAAIGKNNELGKGNQLLWNLPADMAHFRDTTRGHTVIMGRKTFESIGRPLPHRRNIVITRGTTYAPAGVEVAHSLDEALYSLSITEDRTTNQRDEIFIIGGAQIYAEALPRADKLYITHVDGTFDADTFFPTIGPEWKQVSEETRPKDGEHAYDMQFTVYEKIA